MMHRTDTYVYFEISVGFPSKNGRFLIGQSIQVNFDRAAANVKRSQEQNACVCALCMCAHIAQNKIKTKNKD